MKSCGCGSRQRHNVRLISKTHPEKRATTLHACRCASGNNERKGVFDINEGPNFRRLVALTVYAVFTGDLTNVQLSDLPWCYLVVRFLPRFDRESKVPVCKYENWEFLNVPHLGIPCADKPCKGLHGGSRDQPGPKLVSITS